MKEVTSVEVMRRSDAYTIQTETSSTALMYKAGVKVFENVAWHGKIAVVCGKGNNGGDGFVIALKLFEHNYDVDVYIFSNEVSIDAGFYYTKCLKQNIKMIIIDENVNFNQYDIIVDAIFGTGFNKDISGIYQTVINKINDNNKYVVSVDINSGLNGDNGLCNLAVKSDLTISIGTYKTGHFLNQAKDYIGKLINVDIGIKLVEPAYQLFESIDARKSLYDRLNYANKSTYGYICLIGGSSNYSGAIRLASLANASMRSGCGVCRVATIKSLAEVVQSSVLESTVFPLSDLNNKYLFVKEEIDELINHTKVCCVGMGLTNTDDVKQLIKYLLLTYQGVLIIDADGLNALAEIDENLLKTTKAKVVLTPHLKEFSRLSKYKVEDILNSSIEYALEYAKKYNLTLLLKGPTTIVTDGEHLYLVNTGCSGMATAGSGDVLSGIISAIVGYNTNNILNAVATSAYVNGLAGELAQQEVGAISLIASDTVKQIPNVIKMIKTNVEE